MFPSAWRRAGQRRVREEQRRPCSSGQDSERSSGQAGYRLGRLWDAAELRKVPLRTIIAAILAVAFFFLAGKLIYRLRDVVLLLLVAGFLALILNPLVLVLQRYVVRRRGFAVTLVGVHHGAGVHRAGRRVRLPARQRDHPPGRQPAYLRAAGGAGQGLVREARQALPRAAVGAAELVEAGDVRAEPLQAGAGRRQGRAVAADRVAHHLHPGADAAPGGAAAAARRPVAALAHGRRRRRRRSRPR